VLTNIKNANPDIVYVPLYYDSAGPILQEAKTLGISSTFIGSDSWDSYSLIELAGSAANGHYFTNHYFPEALEAKHFVSAYRFKYHGKTPDALAALGYDTALVLFDAIRRAGIPDQTAVRKALHDTRHFQGASGTINRFENGNPIKSTVIIKIENQNPVYYKTVQP
jgi:branched-chain amino acid transport system substrate-binding protein